MGFLSKLLPLKRRAAVQPREEAQVAQPEGVESPRPLEGGGNRSPEISAIASVNSAVSVVGAPASGSVNQVSQLAQPQAGDAKKQKEAEASVSGAMMDIFKGEDVKIDAGLTALIDTIETSNLEELARDLALIKAQLAERLG